MKPNSAHVVRDQTAVADFLGARGTYGQTEPVVRIDTHGAMVFLAGDTAYKIKRADGRCQLGLDPVIRSI